MQEQLTQLVSLMLLTTMAGLILLALLAAITIRIALRPLRSIAAIASRVASQPLDQVEVEITERVPAAQAHPLTETGLVGASLNKLLDHVNVSLAARQKNEELMRRFVADASHELLTPLASIRGYSELSLKMLSHQDELSVSLASTVTSLERIPAQSLRMTRLVEDLLLLARLDDGTELVCSIIDLGQIGMESVSDACAAGQDHRWRVDVPNEPVSTIGDSGRIHQVIANLLSNALSHTPAGTDISLVARTEGKIAVLQVHDNGPGIHPLLREELVSRFARGDSSRTRQTGGSGLGLSIVKAIVEGHSGNIEVSSKPGDTRFTVRFPIVPDEG